MEEKIAELANGTIDEMRVALADLSAEELTALLAAEKAGKKRAGAYELIEDRIKDLGTAQGGNDQGEGAAQGDAAASAEGAAQAGDDRPAESAADPFTPPAENPVEAKAEPEVGRRRIVLVVAGDRAKLVEQLLADLDNGESVAIVFASEEGDLLEIAPIEAKANDFQRFGGARPRLIYKPEIDLPMTLPASSIRKLFLLGQPAEGVGYEPNVVAECKLTADLHAGGGRKAQIPEGNLLFELA